MKVGQYRVMDWDWNLRSTTLIAGASFDERLLYDNNFKCHMPASTSHLAKFLSIFKLLWENGGVLRNGPPGGGQ